MKCSTCGKDNSIVNQCRCDPNNLPTPLSEADILTALASGSTDPIGELAQEIVEELEREVCHRDTAWHDIGLMATVEEILRKHKSEVRIEVRGGVADLVSKPENIRVVIYDHDSAAQHCSAHPYEPQVYE
jgi:hypothetical protein